jgi:hypothetical protein
MRTAVTLLVVLSLSFSRAGAAEPPPPSSGPAADDPRPAWTTVARWYGTLAERNHSYATREPGGFGLALSRPNAQHNSDARVVIGEELSNYGARRAIVESIVWSSSVADQYYQNKDGSKVAAGSGGGGGGTITEADLVGTAPGAAADATQSAEQRVADARQQLRDAEQRLAEAKGQSPRPPADNAGAAAAAAEPEELKKYRAAMQAYAAAEAAASRNPADLEKVREQRDKAAQAYNDWVVKRSAELAAKYTKGLEAKAQKLADPALSDQEKAKLVKEMQAIGEQYAAEVEQFSDVSETMAAQQQTGELERDVAAARRELLAALGDLQELNAPPRAAQAHVNIADEQGPDGPTGKTRVALTFSLEDKKLTRFPVDVIPLELLGFDTVLKKKYEPQNWSASRAVTAFDGETVVMSLDDDTVTIKSSSSKKSGEPGLVGGGEWTRNATFTRVPVKQQVIVRGRVLHRIRIPRDSADTNLLLPEQQGPPTTSAASGAPSGLEGAIPVAGSVLVEAWTFDPHQPAPATRPADVATTTQAPAATFELGVPKSAGKILRLRFTYHNAAARLREMQTIEVKTDDVLAAAASGTAAPLPLDRARTAWFRFGGAPMEYALGVEPRGATVRREGDAVILRFEGLNSILVNTFVLAAPYLNQNNQAFSLTNVSVPAARLVAAAPSFIDQAKVRARLGVPATGAVPKETSTEVKVRGSVVCFPTCLTMTLGGLGIVSLPDDGQRSDEVAKLAQGIYDYWAQRSRTVVAVNPEPPWVFPFPPNPDVANALAAEAEKKAASTDPVQRALAPGLRDKARAMYPPKWPYVDADASDLAKQWLISLGGSGYKFIATSTGDEDFIGGMTLMQWELYRPWQTVEVVQPYFRDVHKISSKVYDKADVFSPSQTRAVLNTLGNAALSIISIDHRDSTGGKGGHIMLLLGAITDNNGNPVRLIVHDPYGDQSQHPAIEGYYAPGYNDDKKLYDKDKSGGGPHGTRGRYAPYGAQINSFDGRMYSKWWLVFDPPEKKPTAAGVQKRLLPSEKWSGGEPATE